MDEADRDRAAHELTIPAFSPTLSPTASPTPMPRLLFTLVLALALGCSEPFVMIPGGSLEGTEAAAPGDWSFSDEVGTVQLETNPADPYSVNIWVTAMGDFLYLHAGTNRATWVEHIEADPRVRMRIEDTLYPLRAVRVEAEDEFARFADAYERKYDTRPRNENVDEAYLFRLEPR